MLGGSVYIAFIRLAINLVGTILIFSLLSESRFSRKKTIVCYGCYGMVLAVLACGKLGKLRTDGSIGNIYVLSGLEISILFLSVMCGRISLHVYC